MIIFFLKIRWAEKKQNDANQFDYNYLREYDHAHFTKHHTSLILCFKQIHYTMKALLLLLAFVISPCISYAQLLNDIDEIAPFHEGLAAVRKGSSWGFINSEGKKTIDFRNDIVQIPTQLKSDDNLRNYPYFSDNRCLIKEVKDGITYYGYIDETGKVVIEAKYLNATSFVNGNAFVIKMYKEKLNATNALGKNIVNYSYAELLIDPNNNTVQYLRGPENLLFSAEHLRTPPPILSRLLSEKLVAVKTNKGTWEIYSLENKKS